MSALAWPFVALVVGLVALWRLDVFARRWAGPYVTREHYGAHQDLMNERYHMDRAEMAKLEARVTELRNDFTHLTNRVGPAPENRLGARR